MALIVATWNTALAGIEQAYPAFSQGRISAADAAELVCKYVEDCVEDASVGYGGLPNARGEMELDAGFMDGGTMDIGGVVALRGFRHPVSVARAVMEQTPHNLLAGRGAYDFALEKGFEQHHMLAPSALKTYQEHRAKAKDAVGHDTVCVIALRDNSIVVGTSTSGLAYKLPGRASDSCLPGNGFFADNEVGAAAATGLGEDIMRGTLARVTVELMRDGASPESAAREAIRRLITRCTGVARVATIAVNMRGEYGGAANHAEFPLSVGDAQGVRTVMFDDPVCCPHAPKP